MLHSRQEVETDRPSSLSDHTILNTVVKICGEVPRNDQIKEVKNDKFLENFISYEKHKNILDVLIIFTLYTL